MSLAQQNSVSPIKDKSHFYSDPRNLITVALWVMALSTHALLMPRLVHELYTDFVKHRS